jgi:hypothetical protein
MKYGSALISIVFVLVLALPSIVNAQPAPPARMSWQQTFNDDMDFVDHAKWHGTYASTLYCNNGNCPENYQGLSSAGGALVLNAVVNYQNFSDLTGRAAENSNGHFSQRYGYFEWRMQLPHDAGGEGDGLWSAAYAFPVGKQAFFDIGCGDGINDSKAEELDVAEVVAARGNMRQVRFTAHDRCYNEYGQLMPATPGADLSAGYHTYGLYWKNDGSSHGTVCGFFDGVQQGNCYTLEPSSKLWDNGIFLLNQLIPCPPKNVPFGGGAPCQSGTSNNNPLYVDYTRAWKLVPNGSTPTPQATPSNVPTPPVGDASITIMTPLVGDNVSGVVQVSATWKGPAGSYAQISLNSAATGIAYSAVSPISVNWDTAGLASPTAQYLKAVVMAQNRSTVLASYTTQVWYNRNAPAPTGIACSAICTGMIPSGHCTTTCSAN